MIPQTIVGFFFFLLLVAPGVAYQLLRERRIPQIKETAFREAARVALYSFLFSFIASLIIVVLRIAFPTFFFDLGAYSHNRDDYVKEHYSAIIWTIALEVLIAFILVFLIDQCLAVRISSKLKKLLPDFLREIFKPDILPYGIWWNLFVVAVREGQHKGRIAQLSIRLTDGTRVAGFFQTCTPYDSFENAEIAIKRGSGPMLMFDAKDPNVPKGFQKLDNDEVIWVRGADISYIKVKYTKRISDAEALARRGLSAASNSDVGKKKS